MSGVPAHMGGNPVIGETFVYGRDQQTARALLNAAASLGIEAQEVRAVGNGFIVPNAVWDTMQEQQTADAGGF